MRFLVMVKSYSSPLARRFASVRKTASARRSNFVTARRTVVAGYVDNLYHVVIGFIAAHGEFHALVEDRALFIYATTHRRRFAGNDHRRNVEHLVVQLVFPGKTRHFAQYSVLKILHFGIESVHSSILSIIFPCKFLIKAKPSSITAYAGSEPPFGSDSDDRLTKVTPPTLQTALTWVCP